MTQSRHSQNNWSQFTSLSSRFKGRTDVTRLRCVVLILEGICETPGFPRIAPRRGGVASRGPPDRWQPEIVGSCTHSKERMP